MSRKVFVSFLGASDYSPCHYYRDNYKSREIRFVQEATIEYLINKGEKESNPWTFSDMAVILLTELAEKSNWVDNGHLDRKTQCPKQCEGLRTRLEKMNLPFPVTPLKGIPEGNNELEIWTIFQRLFSELKDGDELYFDLTHGYRFLPMLILVMGNYTKFLLNAKVKHISYGNFEGRDKIKNEALLVDILSLSALQDWTFAAANYVRNGYADELKELANNALKPFLKDATKRNDKNIQNLRAIMKSIVELSSERQTCRGLSIWSGHKQTDIMESYDNLDYVQIHPLGPIIDKIVDGVKIKLTDCMTPDEDLSEDEKTGLENCLKAARWCYDNRLYQQAVTILQEGIVSFFCLRHGIDIDDRNKREFVNRTYRILSDHKEEKDWITSKDNRVEELALYRQIMEDKWIDVTIKLFSALTEARNDFNHCGFRDSIKTADGMKNEIRRLLEQAEILFLCK